MFLRSCSFLYRVSFSSFWQSSFSCGWQVLLGSTENREFTQRVNKNDSQASARRLHFPQTTGSFRKLPVISQRAWHASPSRKGIKKKISSLPSFSTEINEISKFARGIFNRSSLIFLLKLTPLIPSFHKFDYPSISTNLFPSPPKFSIPSFSQLGIRKPLKSTSLQHPVHDGRSRWSA